MIERMEKNTNSLQVSNIRVLKMEEATWQSYPDFADARISEAEFQNGVTLTESELGELNNNRGLVYEESMKWIH